MEKQKPTLLRELEWYSKNEDSGKIRFSSFRPAIKE
jgi:hypothetical protein